MTRPIAVEVEGAEECTYDLGILSNSLRKWRSSRGLRVVYEALFRQMMAAAHGDKILEVGSGIGALKPLFPDVVTSDIQKTPYVDEAISCYAIEAGDREWSSVVALDVLHHLREPLRFLASAAAGLQPGGRIVLSEPAATPFGRFFYTLCHHEPCRPAELSAPFEFRPDEDGRFANMGMGMALFVHHRNWLEFRLKKMGLRIAGLHFSHIFAYPLSGGFSKPQFLPTAILEALLWLERRLPQWLLKMVALRLLIILEREV